MARSRVKSSGEVFVRSLAGVGETELVTSSEVVSIGTETRRREGKRCGSLNEVHSRWIPASTSSPSFNLLCDGD